ncbi:hypothetical protein QJS66_14135 [Kocuria rhizophila]|nr:hypothetical protein QJS66_14135 [Kocuria rhizophila]
MQKLGILLASWLTRHAVLPIRPPGRAPAVTHRGAGPAAPPAPRPPAGRRPTSVASSRSPRPAHFTCHRQACRRHEQRLIQRIKDRGWRGPQARPTRGGPAAPRRRLHARPGSFFQRFTRDGLRRTSPPCPPHPPLQPERGGAARPQRPRHYPTDSAAMHAALAHRARCRTAGAPRTPPGAWSSAPASPLSDPHPAARSR